MIQKERGTLGLSFMTVFYLLNTCIFIKAEFSLSTNYLKCVVTPHKVNLQNGFLTRII